MSKYIFIIMATLLIYQESNSQNGFNELSLQLDFHGTSLLAQDFNGSVNRTINTKSNWGVNMLTNIYTAPNSSLLVGLHYSRKNASYKFENIRTPMLNSFGIEFQTRMSHFGINISYIQQLIKRDKFVFGANVAIVPFRTIATISNIEITGTVEDPALSMVRTEGIPNFNSWIYFGIPFEFEFENKHSIVFSPFIRAKTRKEIIYSYESRDLNYGISFSYSLNVRKTNLQDMSM